VSGGVHGQEQSACGRTLPPGRRRRSSRGARDHVPCPAKPRPSPLRSGTPRLAPALLLAWREGSALGAPGSLPPRHPSPAPIGIHGPPNFVGQERRRDAAALAAERRHWTRFPAARRPCAGRWHRRAAVCGGVRECESGCYAAGRPRGGSQRRLALPPRRRRVPPRPNVQVFARRPVVSTP
jgi:hypothetical protein